MIEVSVTGAGTISGVHTCTLEDEIKVITLSAGTPTASSFNIFIKEGKNSYTFHTGRLGSEIISPQDEIHILFYEKINRWLIVIPHSDGSSDVIDSKMTFYRPLNGKLK